MNNLNIQYFLRSKPIEDALKDLEELGVYAKKHPDYPELYQFNYDMIESSNHKNHPIVMECRGIILNSNKNWEVVAYPFNRFCNAGENFNYEIDWSTARIQEKFDGSLMIVYFYADKWQVATRNSPNACGNVGNYDFTFAELFWKTFMDLTYSSGKLIPCCTYMFELMSPFNRVVVEQKDNSLVLIGVRNNNNFQELNLDKCIFDEFLFVRSYSVRNLSNVILAASKLNPLQQEGFVIVDDKFNRIKVKCPKYVLIHHMKDGFSTRRMIDLIKLGEKSELLSYFPEYLEEMRELERNIDILVAEYEEFYNQYSSIELQKDFAFKVKHVRFSGVLFSMRKGLVKSIREGFYRIATEKLEDVLT